MRRSFNGNYPITEHFGVVASYYSGYPGSRHPGTDYGLPANTPLVAGMSGTVTATIIRSTYVGRGKEVVITNGNQQRKTCHMNRIDVKMGQTVTEGVTRLGLSGNTGYVLPKPTASNPHAGAHLHDELLIDGTYVDLEKNLKGEHMATDSLTKAEVVELHNAYFGANPGSNYDYRHVTKELQTLIHDWRYSPQTLKNRIAEIQKIVTIKDNEITRLSKENESLKAQMGETTKWQTLRALLRELLGIN